VVGLGLNQNELNKNQRLTERVIHDLNKDHKLPFEDQTFDVVLNTVSVDYLTNPAQVFREAGRVLKPGGLFLVIFSNRMFPQKAVRIWRESSEGERVLLVEDFFRQAGTFEKPVVFISKGRSRPRDDKYAPLLSTSDPIYAVYADKTGPVKDRRPRPEPKIAGEEIMSPEELTCRKRAVKETLSCPYCGQTLKKWAVPDNPFSQTWDNEFMYICFNDDCPYYVRGWNHMARDMNGSNSYRLMYNPEKDCCLPIPVPTPQALKDGIFE
jgi:SAM-dependent methyltransferase